MMVREDFTMAASKKDNCSCTAESQTAWQYMVGGRCRPHKPQILVNSGVRRQAFPTQRGGETLQTSQTTDTCQQRSALTSLSNTPWWGTLKTSQTTDTCQQRSAQTSLSNTPWRRDAADLTNHRYLSTAECADKPFQHTVVGDAEDLTNHRYMSTAECADKPFQHTVEARR